MVALHFRREPEEVYVVGLDVWVAGVLEQRLDLGQYRRGHLGGGVVGEGVAEVLHRQKDADPVPELLVEGERLGEHLDGPRVPLVHGDEAGLPESLRPHLGR